MCRNGGGPEGPRGLKSAPPLGSGSESWGPAGASRGGDSGAFWRGSSLARASAHPPSAFWQASGIYYGLTAA